MFDLGLFGPAPEVFGPGSGPGPGTGQRADDAAVVAAMVRAEVALLRAVQAAGLVPSGEGRPDDAAVTRGDNAVAGADGTVAADDAAVAGRRGAVADDPAHPGGPAADLERAVAGLSIDPADLARRARGAGNPVVPLVKDLVAAVPERARPWVHLGATSQDILDTALVLVARDVTGSVLESLRRARDTAAALARRHRGTAMAGRTLGQVAVPTTFGLKAAGWAVGLDAAAAEVERVRRDRLAVQLAGAAGTLAVYGDRAPQVLGAFARELDLPVPSAPWHTERSRVRELASSLAGAVAAAGKVGTDVALLATTEVGEAAEGGGAGHGGSSAMPHKRNPVTSVLLRAAAVRAPGLLATVYAGSLQEHERATGGWHAEWQPLVELLVLTDGAAQRVHELLTGLTVDAGRMRENLDAARPFVMAEALATRLARDLGRTRAQDAVREALDRAVAAHGDHPTDAELLAVLADVFGHDAPAAGAPTAADLDPTAALGAVDALVDHALEGLGSG